ncbi:MAG TPA: hypothetical protein VJ201_01515 [Candidatus Babeliales bacterium]|nr:hypothetical protein [Candidatus Babeliales bacterium]
MKKCIVSLLLMVSSSIYAINCYEVYLEEQKEIIMLLLQDDHEENLSLLPHDVRKHIAFFMMYSEPWGMISKSNS